MADVKLQGCPFCSAPGVVEKAAGSWMVYCSNPECNFGPESGYESSEEWCIAAWNTRAAPALTPKQVAADEMFDALTQEFVSQNCTCKFLNHVGQEPPCGKCKLGMLLAKAGQP